MYILRNLRDHIVEYILFYPRVISLIQSLPHHPGVYEGWTHTVDTHTIRF